MKRILLILIVLMALTPSPALAQSYECASLDFTVDDFGWIASYGEYVSGQGFRSVFALAENLFVEYDSALVISSFSYNWHVETWGGGTITTYNRLLINDTDLINTTAQGSPAWQSGLWDSDGSPVTGIPYLQLYASWGDGADGLGYLTSVSVCGEDLPVAWNASVEGSGWPTDEPWARATPTPWPTPEATLPFGVVNSDIGGLADNAINLYNFANQSGAIDTLIWILMSLLILALIFRFMKKAKAGT